MIVLADFIWIDGWSKSLTDCSLAFFSAAAFAAISSSLTSTEVHLEVWGSTARYWAEKAVVSIGRVCASVWLQLG